MIDMDAIEYDLDDNEIDNDLAGMPDDGRELFEHYRIVADKGQELLRVDKFLVAHLPNVSRNRIQQAAEASCILVNGKAVKSNYRVKPGDCVSVVIIDLVTRTRWLPRIYRLT